MTILSIFVFNFFSSENERPNFFKTDIALTFDYNACSRYSEKSVNMAHWNLHLRQLIEMENEEYKLSN